MAGGALTPKRARSGGMGESLGGEQENGACFRQ